MQRAIPNKENPLFSGSAAEGGQRGAAVVDTSHLVDTFDLTQSVVAGVSLLHPPAEAASVDERIDFLHQQLDSIGGDADVLNGLVLLGSGTHERLQGGAANHFSCLLYSNYSRTSRLLHHVDAEGSS